MWLNRYRHLRLGSIGPVNAALVPAELPITDLLLDTDQVGNVDVVVVAGSSAGGPAQLVGGVTEAFIECERRAVPTVLLAANDADLHTPVAAVCRDVASAAPAVIAQASPQFGADRTHQLPGGQHPQARRWLKAMVTGVGLRTR